MVLQALLHNVLELGTEEDGVRVCLQRGCCGGDGKRGLAQEGVKGGDSVPLGVEVDDVEQLAGFVISDETQPLLFSDSPCASPVWLSEVDRLVLITPLDSNGDEER